MVRKLNQKQDDDLVKALLSFTLDEVKSAVSWYKENGYGN